MPVAEARIPTDRATRYLEQLCSHLGSMQHMRHLPGSAHASGHGAAGMPRVAGVEQSGNRAVVRFADGSWHLTAHEDALVLRVEADEDTVLDRLKEAIAARIAKIGRRDGLSVDWSSSSAERGGAAAEAEGPSARGRGGRTKWRRLGWIALAALAAAVHLGMIGSLFGSGGSRDIAADAMIALVAVKLVLVGLHTRLKHGRPSRRTSIPDTPGRVETQTRA